MTAEDILKVILERVDLSYQKQLEVLDDIETSLEQGTFVVIRKNGKAIGFFTYSDDGEIFLNNCLIFRDEGRNNLLYLRKTFRERFKNKRFTWESRKRNRMASVK